MKGKKFHLILKPLNQKWFRGRFGEFRADNFYSKSFRGKLNSIFNQSQLLFVGGDRERKRVSFISPQICLPPIETCFESEFALITFKKSFLEASKILLNPSNYIEGLGQLDCQNLLYLARDIALSGGSSAIRVVYGATEKMSLRAISYFIPCLELMNSFKSNGFIVPQLQIIFANNLSGGLNNLDKETVGQQTLRFSKVSRVFIKEYFPDISDFVVFLVDQELKKGSVIRDEMVRVAKLLREKISPISGEELMGKGRMVRNRINYFYAAAHLLVHDADFAIFHPMSDEQSEQIQADSIISFGGLQERLFYKIRHEIKLYLPDSYRKIRTLQYFTKHHVPPYYMARGGDVSLDAALGMDRIEDGLATTAKHDLFYLFSLVDEQELAGFLRKIRKEV